VKIANPRKMPESDIVEIVLLLRLLFLFSLLSPLLIFSGLFKQTANSIDVRKNGSKIVSRNIPLTSHARGVSAKKNRCHKCDTFIIVSTLSYFIDKKCINYC
jgi:hypothetical protein